jgi:hypothetical protein
VFVRGLKKVMKTISEYPVSELVFEVETREYGTEVLSTQA